MSRHVPTGRRQQCRHSARRVPRHTYTQRVSTQTVSGTVMEMEFVTFDRARMPISDDLARSSRAPKTELDRRADAETGPYADLAAAAAAAEQRRPNEPPGVCPPATPLGGSDAQTDCPVVSSVSKDPVRYGSSLSLSLVLPRQRAVIRTI